MITLCAYMYIAPCTRKAISALSSTNEIMNSIVAAPCWPHAPDARHPRCPAWGAAALACCGGWIRLTKAAQPLDDAVDQGGQGLVQQRQDGDGHHHQDRDRHHRADEALAALPLQRQPLPRRPQPDEPE